jgi:hypothetical protein
VKACYGDSFTFLFSLFTYRRTARWSHKPAFTFPKEGQLARSEEISYLRNQLQVCFLYKKGYGNLRERSSRPLGLWGVKVFTFCTQSAHRWRWGQRYAPAVVHTRKICGTHLCWGLSRSHGRSEARRVKGKIKWLNRELKPPPSCIGIEVAQQGNGLKLLSAGLSP